MMSQRSIVELGRHVAVDTHPLLVASYTLSVRQYRTLQYRFLHCIGHPKPTCDLLRFKALPLRDRTLTCWKINLNTPFVLTYKICTFEFFIELHKECAHAHAGHTQHLPKSGGSVLCMTIFHIIEVQFFV
jgi:hypothetical protein